MRDPGYLSHPTEEIVTFATQNTGSIIGIRVSAPGLPVSELLDRRLIHDLRNVVTDPFLDDRRRYIGDIDLQGGKFEAEVFRADKQLVLEISPHSGGEVPTAYEALYDAELLSSALDLPDSISFEKLTGLLRTLSGYHSVVLERLEGSSRLPIAVSGANELSHLPSTHPQQLHFVQDTNSPTTQVELSSDGGLPELGLSGLISPPLEQLEELCSSGVSACAAFGIWRDNVPLAVIKFFHRRPRVPNKRTRIVLEHLAPQIRQRLNGLPQ